MTPEAQRLAEEASIWIAQVVVAAHQRSPARTKVAVEALEAFIDRLASLIPAGGLAEEARASVLEEAAKVCEDMHDEDRPSDYAYAIRELAGGTKEE